MRKNTDMRLIFALIILIMAMLASTVGERTEVCHRGSTISVSSVALNAHLAHGDTVDACAILTPFTRDRRAAPVRKR